MSDYQKLVNEVGRILREDLSESSWVTDEEIRTAIAIVRAAVIEECARAMNPMLRSMISRDEAARIIRSLAKGDRDE